MKRHAKHGPSQHARLTDTIASSSELKGSTLKTRRSKWEVQNEDGSDDDLVDARQDKVRKHARRQGDMENSNHADGELHEREVEARAKAAAKMVRQRSKVAQHRLPDKEHHNMDTSNGSGSASSTAKPLYTEKAKLSREAHPKLTGCRSVHCYERLNHIEEGSYGVVFRARERESGDIVAIKKLKMDREKNGFPITSLREIRSLMEAEHDNVVRAREIVVGDTLTQIFIVMDFVEHDLKTLLSMQTMPFLASEIKTLLHQVLSAVSLLHRNWIIHRDLKTSNLLMNNRGQVKLADFGLARTYGEPCGAMTSLVVTLWYRAPELLLGAQTYDTAIDMWSIGCIFAELITTEPLFPGKNETDQITKIFRLLGQPNDEAWPDFRTLPNAKSIGQVAQPFSTLRQKFRYSTDKCIDLLQRLLTFDPARRITADEALRHAYFGESPAPAHPDTFGSFPSVAAGEKRRIASPEAPPRRADAKNLAYQLELDV